jgi:hypothetical protein
MKRPLELEEEGEEQSDSVLLKFDIWFPIALMLPQEDLASFRFVCKAFADIGMAAQFRRFSYLMPEADGVPNWMPNARRIRIQHCTIAHLQKLSEFRRLCELKICNVETGDVRAFIAALPNLPTTLKTFWWTDGVPGNFRITAGTFPDTLEELRLGSVFENDCYALVRADLPKSLKVFALDECIWCGDALDKLDISCGTVVTLRGFFIVEIE